MLRIRLRKLEGDIRLSWEDAVRIMAKAVYTFAEVDGDSELRWFGKDGQDK